MTFKMEISHHGTCILFETNLTANQVRKILKDYTEDECKFYIEAEMEDTEND